MIELTVKTLDSKNHAFSVPDDITVKQLKERITESVNISTDSQRLIYCGRVLQDDKNLSEYDVNGKVIHLVQRAPPVSNGSGPDRGPTGTRMGTSSGTPNVRRAPLRLFGPGGNTGNAMYLGAMAFPAEIMDASGISMQQPRQCLSRSRLNVVRNMLRRATVLLNRLENPNQDTDTSPDNGTTQLETNSEEESAAGGTPIASVEITPTSFIIENNQVDVGGPSTEVQSDTPLEHGAPITSPETETQATNEQQPLQNENEDNGNDGNSRYPRTQALAELLDQVNEVNTRLQPFMSQYQQLMRDDPTFSDQASTTVNQRIFTGVSEVMHNLAHAYHALSDIMCDFSQPPPRFLRCRPVLIHHSAVVQTGIPIQVANLVANSNSQHSSTTANATTTGNSRSNGNTTTSTAGVTASEPTPTTAQPQSATSSGGGQNTPATPTSSSSAQRQARSPSISPPRVSRIGSGGPGFEIFVDVAPGSITIDSLEATVLTNNPTATDVTSLQNPPEFVQNLITALAGQFMGATLQQYGFPNQQNASSASQQQASGNSSSSQAPSQTTSQTGTSGQAAAATTQATANSQAATSSQAAATPVGSQSSQARSNTATHLTTVTQTRSTPRPHVHLSPSIHSLRTNCFDPFLPCNSHHIRNSRGVRQRSASAAAGQAQSSNGASAASEPRRSASERGATNINITVHAGEPIITIDQPASRSSENQPAAQSPLPPELQAIFQSMRGSSVPTEQMFPQQLTHLVQAMYDGQNPATLAQLLHNVPGYAYTPGDSIFTDIFMILAQSLSFMDLVQLGLGSSECLIRAHPQLRELVSQRLLNNQPLTISSITQIIDRFNAELRPHYNVFDSARLREEVDLPATINLYNHSMLPSIINAIMEEDQNTFHRTLMRKCVLYVRQLCALLYHCCLDGVSGLESIIRAFVTQMTTSVPGVLQEWTMAHSIINFRSFISSMNVPTEDIRRYVVYRIGCNPPASPQPATTPSIVPPAAEPMDVQDIVESESTPTLREPPLADLPPTQHLNDPISWQNALPSEWVPVITRDCQRQRRQSPQGPFSDAYLSGMPSKRRKLIQSTKPQGNLSQIISESMATALGTAGMSSGPEVEVVAQRAGQDGSLRAAYREQVRTTLRHNLNSNPDYFPEKYPNTAKYFKKQ